MGGKTQSWGMGFIFRRGSGMVPFERGLMTSYRHSIVTFPLYLPVSEILPFLCASVPIFSHPTSSLPKMYPCSPRSRWMALWIQRAKALGQLLVQLVTRISSICGPDPPTSRTDRQTDDMRSQYRALHYSAWRVKNSNWKCIWQGKRAWGGELVVEWWHTDIDH